MKKIKLNNVIFPFWMILFFPPVIFLTLGGNYIIDSLVVILCFRIFKLQQLDLNLKTFYKKSILKVWLYGFFSDVIGSTVLLFFGIFDGFGLSYDITSAINYDPYKHPVAVLIIIFAMFISGLFIYLFNYNLSFKKLIEDKHLRVKVSLTVALITIPWTFLLPTNWFYHGI